MKIKLDEIAQTLIENGFKSQEIDSEELTNRVIEILSDKDFFINLHEEMIAIEDKGNYPRNKTDYDESIGEF